MHWTEQIRLLDKQITLYLVRYFRWDRERERVKSRDRDGSWLKMFHWENSTCLNCNKFSANALPRYKIQTLSFFNNFDWAQTRISAMKTTKFRCKCKNISDVHLRRISEHKNVAFKTLHIGCWYMRTTNWMNYENFFQNVRWPDGWYRLIAWKSL